MQHGPLRNAYLDALGIDRWVPRDATAEVAPGPFVANAEAPVAQAPQVRAPLAPPVPLEPGIDWGPLRERVAGCTACDLCKTRTQTVFGVGNTRAEWLIIGEAPGAEEDRQGEPFVGRAGQLLNAMLRAIATRSQKRYRAACRISRTRLRCSNPGSFSRSGELRHRTCSLPMRRWHACAARCTALASRRRRWSSPTTRPIYCARHPTSARPGKTSSSRGRRTCASRVAPDGRRTRRHGRSTRGTHPAHDGSRPDGRGGHRAEELRISLERKHFSRLPARGIHLPRAGSRWAGHRL